MFSEQYPHLLVAFRGATKTVSTLEPTLSMYSGQEIPQAAYVWLKGVGGFAHVMMHLAVCLASHPEWAEELNRLMEPEGCTAQKVFLIREFLDKKGEKLNEGKPLVVIVL